MTTPALSGLSERTERVERKQRKKRLRTGGQEVKERRAMGPISSVGERIKPCGPLPQWGLKDYPASMPGPSSNQGTT